METSGRRLSWLKMFSARWVFFIAADDDFIVEFMLDVASYTYEPDEIEQWLREHAEAL
jgi:hypothetical protein